MAMRRRMKRSKSRKIFRRTASKVHRKNHIKPMRGGYRI
jgi:hypothetical protein